MAMDAGYGQGVAVTESKAIGRIKELEAELENTRAVIKSMTKNYQSLEAENARIKNDRNTIIKEFADFFRSKTAELEWKGTVPKSIEDAVYYLDAVKKRWYETTGDYQQVLLRAEKAEAAVLELGKERDLYREQFDDVADSAENSALKCSELEAEVARLENKLWDEINGSKKEVCEWEKLTNDAVDRAEEAELLADKLALAMIKVRKIGTCLGCEQIEDESFAHTKRCEIENEAIKKWREARGKK